LENHDVLLKVNDKPLESPEDLREAVVGSKGEPLTIQLLRARKELTVKLTPEKRQPGPGEPGEGVWFREFFGVPSPGVARSWPFDREQLQRSLDERLQKMADQVEELRKMIESLKRESAPKKEGRPKAKSDI
jgi:membrane-associated protease RseP (regulator of RpoE activity)